MTINSQCLLCNTPMPAPALHLGHLPPCNRFEPQANRHPLALQECSSCNLIQLHELPPIAEIKPRVSWIRYNEPDAHLASVSQSLLQHLNPQARAVGLGPFDQPLLNLLQEQGIASQVLDVLPKESGFSYLETIQAQYQPQLLNQFASKTGKSNLLVCRYVLEHCHNPLQALASFRELLSENGLVMIEVPDSSKFLANQDYSFIWEEHTCYFTQDTLTQLIHQADYDLIEMLRFEGQLEDALVAIIRPGRKQAVKACKPNTLFSNYVAAFDDTCDSYQQKLDEIKASGGGIAVFGAGHQAIMFINALGLQDCISYLVDDDANKQGYFLPGTEVPIVSSSKLLEDDSVNTCLLAVSPKVEAKIQEKCASFLNRGGKMYSIFPGSQMEKLI